MGNGETIRDYLISLGFRVDTNSLQQANNAMNTMESLVRRFASTSVTRFAVAGTAVVAFVAAVIVSIKKLTSDLAQNDLEMEKWSRAMFTTKDNAYALNDSIKAMGVSMQDLYLSPELLDNFNKLRQQSFQMMPPEEFEKQMKFVRSIAFEWQRFTLEVTYALRWVGYYLFKYLEKPLSDMKLSFKGFNDIFIKEMPKWTKTIAQVLSWFVRLGSSIVTVGKTIWNIFKEIPKSLLIAGGAVKGFFMLLKTGPIGWIIAGLTTLLLLIDDFQTYNRGGKSAFQGLWEGLEDNGVFKGVTDLKDSFMDLLKSVGNIIDKVWELIKTLTGTTSFKEFADLLENRISHVLEGIAKWIQTITDLLNGDFKKALEDAQGYYREMFQNGQEWDYDQILENQWGALKSSGEIITNPSKWWEDVKKSWNDLINGNVPLVNPQASLNSMNNAAYVTPQTYRGSVNTNQTNNFNIHGGGEPGAVAMAVSRQIPTNIMVHNNRRVIV
jgi:hypothetical protein